MIDVYEKCPVFENEKYFLRMVIDEDAEIGGFTEVFAKVQRFCHRFVTAILKNVIEQRKSIERTEQLAVSMLFCGNIRIYEVFAEVICSKSSTDCSPIFSVSCNYNSIADEIYRLREVKQNALVDNAERESMKQRISEMQQFIEEQTQDVTEYDGQLVRRLIEKIMVYEEKVMVEFKSGTSVDVRR